MPIRSIDTYEWSTVLEILPEKYTSETHNFEIPQELIDRHDRIMAEFGVLQTQLYRIARQPKEQP